MSPVDYPALVDGYCERAHVNSISIHVVMAVAL